jgi:hypothetical protein
MTCTELTLRIIDLCIAFSIPVLITIFGFKLSGKIEDIKNESASKYLWRTKWTDVLFQKHLEYCNSIVEFIAIWSRLVYLLEIKQANSNESLQLQEKNNKVVGELYKTSTDLKLHSINVLGQNNEIEPLLDEIWGQIKFILNEKKMNEQVNPTTIFLKLADLNHITSDLVEKQFNKTFDVSKK